MKKLLGWLVEFYPNHVFYGTGFKKYFDFTIDEEESVLVHRSDSLTCLLGITVIANDYISEAKGSKLVVDHTGVTSGGKVIGNFRTTVERMS